MGNNKGLQVFRGVTVASALLVVLAMAVSARNGPGLDGGAASRLKGRSLAAPLALGTSLEDVGVAAATSEYSSTTTVIHTIGKKVVDRGRFSGPVPRFEQRDIDERTAGEPMVVFNRDGDAFYSSMIGREGTFGFRTVVLKSTDDGESWSDVSPLDPTSSNTYMTFDPYVHADPVTGRVFSVDWVRDVRGAPPYQCLHVASTDDGGATWKQSPFCPGGDHQTLWTGPPTAVETKDYPNVVYLYSNFCGWESWPTEVAHESCFVRSLDGGMTWSDPMTIFEPGCGAEAGHGAASWTDGTIYLPRVTCEFPESDEDAKQTQGQVAVSRDNGKTWDVVVVNDKWVRGEDGIGGTSTKTQHEARMAVDAAGNAYYVFTDFKGMPRLSISRDQGRTWSKPMSVAAPGLKGTNSNFIGIAAGEPGKIAFTYLGTPGSAEGGELVWNQYVGMSLNALAKKPVIATTTTNAPDEPLKRGDCGGSFNRCPGTTGQGGMMDFFNIEINSVTGMVWTSLVDICTMTCDGPNGTSDYEGNQGGVGVQVAGPKFGTHVP